MDISIIICTYNRSESLKRTLQNIREMIVPSELRWEIVVIDNNSKDNTMEVVEVFMKTSGLNCRYVFEDKQGLSNARNRGIKEAKGEIIAFTDDDIIVDRNWLYNIVKAFKVTNAACIGGKILPIWESSCPKWFTKELSGYLGILDLGNENIRLKEPKLWGGNFAVKSSIFQKYGFFDIQLGRLGNKLYDDEETEFIRKLIEKGENVFFFSNIIVHHFIPSKHTKKSYFRKRRYDQGEQKGMQLGHYTYRNIMSTPLYAIGRVVEKLVKYLWMQIITPQNAFLEQLKLIYYIGLISGRIKYKK